MDLSTRMEKMVRMDCLIRLEGTGAPRQFAEHIGVSESTLYELLKLMKQMGADIRYNKHRQTYYYQTPVKFHYGFRQLDS